METLRAQISFAGASDAEGEKPKRRRFRMTGYAGSKVRGGRLVLDASGFRHKKRVPILLEHDASRRAGFADVIEVVDGELQLEGYLLSNEHGKGVASDSDEGFPFEASVGLSDIAWEHLEAGDKAELNGVTIEGPVSIGRKARLAEVSFVTSGADANTHAIALAGAPQSTQPPEVSAVDIDTLKAQHALALAERETECAKLSEQLTAATAELDALRTAAAEKLAAERAEYLSDIQSRAVELQSPIPASDVEQVEAMFAKGDDATARTLGAAFLSRSEALASAADVAEGVDVPLGVSADADEKAFQASLAEALAAEGIDPSNPRRIKV